MVDALVSRSDGPDEAAIVRFVRQLLPSQEAEQVLNGFYTDALHTSLLSRLAALRGDTIPKGRRRVCPLPAWKPM